MTKEIHQTGIQAATSLDLDRAFLLSIGVVPYDVKDAVELRRERRRDYTLMGVAVLQLGSLAGILLWSFVR